MVTMCPSCTAMEIWRFNCWMHGRGHGKKMKEGKEKREGGMKEKGKWKGNRQRKGKEKRKKR